MPQRKLFLLLTLVAVLGGSAIWYMETKLGIDSVPEENLAITPMSDEEMVTETEEDVVSVDSAMPRVVTPSTPTAASGATIDSDIAALQGSYDASYDDTSLDAEFTNEGSNTLTDSYDF